MIELRRIQGFNHLTEDLRKQNIAVILTKTQPRVLSVLLGVKPKLYVHSDGTDLRILLKGMLNFCL